MKVYYKIVTINNKTLFHGVNGSKKLESGKWLKAEIKIVSDGKLSRDTNYLSGWHIIDGKKNAEKYLLKFKNPNNKKIIECHGWGIRKKQHSKSAIFLAEEIYIKYMLLKK